MLKQWVLEVLLKLLSKTEKAGQSGVQSMKERAANEGDMQQPQKPKKRAAKEDDMQQPRTPNKRTKLNVGETYQSQMPGKRGLKGGNS